MARRTHLKYHSINITCKCFGIYPYTFLKSKLVNLKSIRTTFPPKRYRELFTQFLIANELKAGPFEATKWPTNPEKLI